MKDDQDGRAAGCPDGASTRLTRAPIRLVDRVLDGTRVWGSIEAGPPRRGFRRYRLILLPPGVTLTERRLLRLWRAMPTWVGVLWLTSLICLTQVFSPWVALATATAIYLAVGLVTFDLRRMEATHHRPVRGGCLARRGPDLSRRTRIHLVARL